MPKAYDLIVLGSGPAATRVATRCAREDWRVAVIDPVPIGGTCALRGCNPKKVLVRAAELVDRARCLSGKGTQLGEATIQWSDLVRFKRQFTEPVTDEKRESFAELGIEVIQGQPEFVGPSELEVDDRRLSANKFLIATGASPVQLPFDGADCLTTSDEFMELDSLPRRVCFAGGGYISFEFAHVAARAGAAVTIIERSQPLEAFEARLVDKLIDRSHTIGIEVLCQREITSVRQKSNQNWVLHYSGNNEHSTIETDLVIHGAGRIPNIEGLGLEAAGVRFDETGIKVNEYFQSVSNEAVYAAGDVVDSQLPPLTPSANYQGLAVAKNMLEGHVARNEYPVVPTAVFTIPNLAKVGLTEQQANAKGLDCQICEGDWSKFNSMKKVGETHAAYKILINRQNQQIMGAHLLGPGAAETINLFALAMAQQISAPELKKMLLVFPTFASDIQSML